MTNEFAPVPYLIASSDKLLEEAAVAFWLQWYGKVLISSMYHHHQLAGLRWDAEHS